jgi:RNA polymerase sigma-70 factor (ECF subfamily)
VARFDREDRAGGGEHGLRLDVAGLAEVRRDAGVLEDLCGRDELRLVRDRVLEAELRLRDGLAAERLLQSGDVRRLVLRHEVHERLQVAVAVRDLVQPRLLVELGLEVLEGQRVVQDRDVARRGAGGCERRERAHERAAAENRGAAEAGLLEERGARLANCPVRVQLLERQMLGHAIAPFVLRAGRAWFDPDGEPVRTRRRINPVTRELAHLSDEALVALTARGEERALAELYDRMGGVAFGLAKRILRDQALAEDAVQEAFLAVWRGSARFVPERSRASTWVLMLVHRRAVDLVRSSQRRRAESIESAPEEADPNAADAAFRRLERERIVAALAKLPEREREAIELAYYGGFTQSELAERLGEPLGTIKSRMFSGLKRLRQLLGDDETEPGWTRTEFTS